MATKAKPLSETHPDLVGRWMGNVSPVERRTPDSFGIKARFECWWWCGREAHPWFASQPGAHLHAFQCPACIQERRDESARVLSLPVSRVPELVAAWRDPRPFDGLSVDDLCGGVAGKNFGLTYSLRCEANHKIDTVVRSFVLVGCPWCRGTRTRQIPRESVLTSDPELAALLHPTRNGDLTPDIVPADHRGVLWWLSPCCGHEWPEDIRTRTLGRRPQAGRGHFYCPKCESVWGSLAWVDPELAAEWHPDNLLTAWHAKPFATGMTVRWRCSANPEHEWDAKVSDRSSGRLCPMCSTAGTSSIERAFLAAVKEHDPLADAARVDRWRVDVLAPSLGLVLEYDGEYWHRAKSDVDARKTRDLIAKGYRVARIRENDLPLLDLSTSQLRQVSFWPSTERPSDVVRRLVNWINGGG
jgi:hypothetical protein